MVVLEGIFILIILFIIISQPLSLWNGTARYPARYRRHYFWILSQDAINRSGGEYEQEQRLFFQPLYKAIPRHVRDDLSSPAQHPHATIIIWLLRKAKDQSLRLGTYWHPRYIVYSSGNVSDFRGHSVDEVGAPNFFDRSQLLIPSEKCISYLESDPTIDNTVRFTKSDHISPHTIDVRDLEDPRACIGDNNSDLSDSEDPFDPEELSDAEDLRARAATPLIPRRCRLILNITAVSRSGPMRWVSSIWFRWKARHSIR